MVKRYNEMFKGLSDLPNFRTNFIEPLEKMGITSVTDLQEALNDDSRTSAILDISGVGQKTIESWRDAVAGPSITDNVSDIGNQEIISEENEAAEQKGKEPLDGKVDKDTVQESTSAQAGPVKEEMESESTIEKSQEITEQSVQPRNLYCSIENMNDVKETLTTLLQWNGAKKKGLARSVKYAVGILEGVGLTVSVIEDAGPQIIVASKGNGGVVLWGHLDTDGECNMDRSLKE